MARKKKPPEVKAGCPEWLAQYGDMVTLVLTFFVLLFSFSTIDAQKWKLVASSLSGMPSIFDGTVASMVPGNQPAISSGIADLDIEDMEVLSSSDAWDQIVGMVKKMLESENMEGQASMSADATQIKVTLEGDVLFDSGKAELKEGSAEVLVEIMRQLESADKTPIIETFRVEGHTDNVPIDTAQYPNNWYLSAARALVVRQFLQDNFPPEEHPDFPESIYSAEGRGEWHPVADNDTPEGRAKNRRVEFIIIRDTAAAPAPETIPLS